MEIRALSLDVRVHSFAIENIRLAELINLEVNFDGTIGFYLEVVPLSEAMSISILTGIEMVLIL